MNSYLCQRMYIMYTANILNSQRLYTAIIHRPHRPHQNHPCHPYYPPRISLQFP